MAEHVLAQDLMTELANKPLRIRTPSLGKPPTPTHRAFRFDLGIPFMMAAYRGPGVPHNLRQLSVFEKGNLGTIPGKLKRLRMTK